MITENNAEYNEQSIRDNNYEVVGRWNARTGFTPYENRHFGPAAVNEVVQWLSGYHRTFLDEFGRMRLWDVTADVAEYHASLVLEARIRAVHGTVLAALRTLSVGSDEALDAFLAPLAEVN